MELKRLIILSALLAPMLCLAETASDYVHRGAQEYIFGYDDKAEAEVKTGLQKFPNDPELQNMTGLFRKKQQAKQSKNQQNQQQPQSSGQGQQQDQQQQNQQTQSQNQSNANQNQNSKQDQSSQQMAKNEPHKNQQQPKPGESPSPSGGKGQQQNNQSSSAKNEDQDQKQSGKQDQPEQSPTPGEGEDQMASPSPGEGQGEGENATPSATPTGSPEKKFAGEIKGANQDKPPLPQNADAFAEMEPEKEGQMSEKQAEMLLQSMKDEEARVQLDERKVRRRVYNDW